MDKLLQMIKNEKIEFLEKDMTGRNKGFYSDNVLMIDQKMLIPEKRCTISEELGHHFKTFGDITDQSKIENRKQEKKARAWGYEHLVPLTLLAEAINYPCLNKIDLAEYLDVTEEYLLEAISYYKSKYGLYVNINEYTIWFEPLRLIKMFE